VSDYLFFDASVFYLQYNNRIGTVTQQRSDGSFYNYRTNVGNSTSKGVEALADFSFVRAFTTGAKNYDVTAFISYSYINAKYGDFKVITRDGNVLKETNLKNKRVENAPENIVRTGVTLSYKDFSLTTQVSHTGEAFADANNTVEPSANGQNGLIPAYTVADVTAVYKWKKNCNIRIGINNLTNEKYFTRRAGGYPGPGLLPAEARSVFVSFGISL
jgi:Fe(3+) dicitrate transport protein